MKRFDIAPFALPNAPAGELKFEESRDIETVEVDFAGPAPRTSSLQYMRKTWPQSRVERTLYLDTDRPINVGWQRMDDLFTPAWVDAATNVTRVNSRTLRYTFKPLTSEMPDVSDYAVTFRRTVGVRVTGDGASVRAIRVFTRSQPIRTALRVELHAGKRTAAQAIELSGYNTVVSRVTVGTGTRANGSGVRVGPGRKASFGLDVAHMLPGHGYAHDDGHVLFGLGKDAFTISLTSLAKEGPIWFAEAGIYIARADDPETFEQYRARTKPCLTVARQVAARAEQSLAGAMNGQMRPHPIAYCCGAKHARQKFWIEPCGDVELTQWLIQQPPAADTPRWKNDGNARIFFGFDRWAVEGRHNDPWPVMSNNLQFRRDAVRAVQKSFAVTLAHSILAGEPAPDATMVALIRFRFENLSDRPATAELPLSYSHSAARIHNRREARNLNCAEKQTDTLLPRCERETLTIEGDRVLGAFKGEQVLRLAFQTDMQAEARGDTVRFRKELAPGAQCELLVRIPYVALAGDAEVAALRALDFDRCYGEMAQYWRAEGRKGAQIHTPEPHLNAGYTGHLPIVLMTDLGYPDGSGLVNTSVGTTTYGNCTNESVMVVEELQQRGLPDEVRRRLGIWVKYQGTAGLKGRFTDHEGVLFGAGGMQWGDSYNQHHGWALWALATHYLHTGDRDWFAGVAEAVVLGSDWIVRQRRETLKPELHSPSFARKGQGASREGSGMATAGSAGASRGWERGFLAAGALEDVDDYFYWLSTNALTWRGLNSAAEALERFEHPEATRLRREANAYRRSLIAGFETARQHSPLIRLRDGRWIPHYPSRLYCRGRDYGWIRETLEGSVYLLISGLYKPESKQAGWILDDYLDTRYMNAPYSYVMEDPQTQWFDCGGICPQPALLAGLLPHLDRDEIEVYLWMFFNAWAACYRPEAQAFVEHPQPVLGFGNCAPFKTSDQSNAMKWLAYLFVYERDELLHIGRAIPRAWFAQEQAFSATRLSTPAGIVSVEYRPQLAAGKIEAEVELELRAPSTSHRAGKPDQLLLRFRHPEKTPIQSVTINGHASRAFDARSGDVELTGVSGKVRVVVGYT